MFIVGNLFISIAEVLNMILDLYMWMIIIAALLSWVNPDPYNPIVNFLTRVTDPVLNPIRRRIGYLGGFDISPVIALLVITFLKHFIVGTLVGFGTRMN